jgi:hypothetical protein
MRVLARITLGFLFSLTLSTTVFGQEFRILNLTQSLGLPFGSGVSLNDQDVIATLVHIEGIGEIVTVDINGAFTNLTQGQFHSLGQPSINNLGQIVFPGNVEPPTAANGDVIFWNGSSFQNITNGSIPVYPAGVLGRALNDSGLVAIGTTQGLVLYNGVDLTLLTSGTSITDTGNQPPSINASGQIAFLGYDFIADQNDIYLFDGVSFINLTNDPALQIVDVNGYPSSNDHGHVVFISQPSGVPSNHLFFYNGTNTTNLTTTLGIPGTVGCVSVNNRDQIAFTLTGVGSGGPLELWFADVNTGRAKRIDSGVEVCTVQINNHGNIAYITDQNLMLATLTSQDVTPPRYQRLCHSPNPVAAERPDGHRYYLG